MSITKHFLLATPMAYGHIRLEVGFACDAVLADPNLLFTVFVVNYATETVTKEVLGKLGPDTVSRVRVIGVGNAEKPESGSVTPEDLLTVPIYEAYRDLFEHQVVTCNGTGVTYDYRNIPSPSAVFVDAFSLGVANVITARPEGMKIIHIFPSTANVTLVGLGPVKYGGWYEVEDQARALIEEGDSRNLSEVVWDILSHRKEAVLPNAEELGMFEYERWPQIEIPKADSGRARKIYDDLGGIPVVDDGLTGPGRTKKMVQIADAAIVFTTHEFEPKSSKAIVDWYEGELGKKLFFVGPPRAFDIVPYASKPTLNHPVFDFLKAQPVNSTILISFGTVYYPTQAWQVETLYRTLLAARTPFVASRASHAYQPIDMELETEISSSGLGLFVDYLPQREVLKHPSIAAFLTHGGANSMFESILAGVPSIFWPFTADQPMHAAYMSQKLNCAWELIQIRTGDGANVPFRGGKVAGTREALADEINQVLTELGSEVGKCKKKNLSDLQSQTLKSLDHGGVVDKAMKDLILYATQKDSIACC